ncbi:DegQ family serine endoprotease [Bartonella sp. DGB2]|uniref:DegQ family serine endoprotease n=1 Tax=Bartonella sp. DGB2 TaxID=3388426 RepID=UPI00398FE545
MRFLRNFKTLLIGGLLIAFPVYAQAEIPQSREQITFSFAPLVKKAIPAVVNIYAARQVRSRSPFTGDPFFEQFFGRQFSQGPARIQSSLGSGVIVDPSGLVVTNYHVIRDADDIKVALSDGRAFESVVMLKDEASDIAILKIETKAGTFSTLALGDSDTVEVGDLVLAIGNPFGVGQTVTSGIVSANARTRVGISDLDFFIQTDAAINPGNSGGALVNMKGQLIGINTAIYSRSGGSVGIGFAIPANLVRAVVDAAKRGSKYFEPPYIGAAFQAITRDVAEGLGMDRPSGAIVSTVVADGPAAKAGIKVGDVVIKVQGQKVENPDSLLYRLMTARVGDILVLTYIRDGKVARVSVPIEMPNHDMRVQAIKITGDSPFSGLSLMALTPNTSGRFHLSSGAQGLVVDNIARGSLAARFFQTGDVLREVNGTRLTTIDDLRRILEGKKPLFWRFEYMRNGVLIQQYIR